jgi:hypothetical protein
MIEDICCCESVMTSMMTLLVLVLYYAGAGERLPVETVGKIIISLFIVKSKYRRCASNKTAGAMLRVLLGQLAPF